MEGANRLNVSQFKPNSVAASQQTSSRPSLFAGFFPAIGISISVCLAAALRGFLALFFGALASEPAPPTLLRSASIRSTAFSPRGRSFATIGLPARLVRALPPVPDRVPAGCFRARSGTRERRSQQLHLASKRSKPQLMALPSSALPEGRQAMASPDRQL